MPANRVLSVRTSPAAGEQEPEVVRRLRAGIAQIRREQDLDPAFPPAVEEEATRAAAGVRLPDLDLTDVPFVTLDPAGARDLDQALHLERDGDGYLVRYAIADVAAFVEPGGAVDVEAHRRGETCYGADSKVPLHPTAISEDAGSLLPEQLRPALVWSIRLDAAGERRDARVERARVRSRARLSYDEAQESLDAEGGAAGEHGPLLALLRDVGRLREALEAERGGVSLPLPEQVVEVEADGLRLTHRAMLPVEGWNAQISLLTGFAAAEMMLRAGVGVLRTLPPVDPRDVARLRRTAAALAVAWPADQDHSAFIRSLDPARPEHAAMVVAATRLLRGSGYATFDAAAGTTPPDHPEHAGLGSTYAHCTAPLRRLVDRYALEVCVALSAGVEVPGWVRDALPDLPREMQDSGRRARQYENAVLDLVEALLLEPRVGELLDGVVVEVDERDERRGEVRIAEPAVEEPVVSTGGPMPLGDRVRVRLASVDVSTREVTLTWDDDSGEGATAPSARDFEEGA